MRCCLGSPRLAAITGMTDSGSACRQSDRDATLENYGYRSTGMLPGGRAPGDDSLEGTTFMTGGTGNAAAQLAEKIERKQSLTGIVGLGYVGLPLINSYIHAGFPALGFDTDQAKVDHLRAGRSYIAHIDAAVIRSWLETGRFDATSDMQRLAEPDVILICVPTPLNDSRDPDLQYIESTTQAIARVLRPGQLVVLESTTYPGTTRDVVVPILEQSGLVAGRDFFVGFSPEREDPGNPTYTSGTIPKITAGIDAVSGRLVAAFYRQAICEVVPVSTCEAAEAAKILENTYRSVNIAMVNELKMLLDRLGIDVWEVIDAAKTKPFGFQAFYPGPGLGGHCIPIDPFYLSWVARKHEFPAKFIELAGEINARMPEYVVSRLARALNSVGKPIRGSRIGILGVAYKRDIDDPRESPAFKLMVLLEEQGAKLSYSDPHIPKLPKMRHFNVPPLASQAPTPEYLAGLDCALIVTDHSAFQWDEIVRHSKLVVDTRNATRNVTAGREKIWKA
jgi:UDP-N-acetyl-D-glucosamine dehydrogenase